jgi:hypothetical protein
LGGVEDPEAIQPTPTPNENPESVVPSLYNWDILTLRPHKPFRVTRVMEPTRTTLRANQARFVSSD